MAVQDREKKESLLQNREDMIIINKDAQRGLGNLEKLIAYVPKEEILKQKSNLEEVIKKNNYLIEVVEQQLKKEFNLELTSGESTY